MKKTTKRYHNEQCNNSMTFQECELAILRHAVDESVRIQGKKITQTDEIWKIINTVEQFIIRKKLVCYGGTAINNILPKNAQFYDHEVEIPDYDFFSGNALNDAKELADIYSKEGYEEVEAKSGVHYGTFKVYVNFIPVADITQLHPELFKNMQSMAILRAGIRYANPDYLRMSMYLELSRPAGDVSRWEKVLKRLTLLNKYYPLKPKVDCSRVDFQRSMDSIRNKAVIEKIYNCLRDSFIEQGVVFFGGYANNLYARYMPKSQRSLFLNHTNPDFDVLADDIELCSFIACEKLRESGIYNVKEVKHPEIGEIVPERIEILVGKDTVAIIYKPIACHNYNIINIQGNEVKVATIDTMLSFYLAFMFVDEYREFQDRILCMAKFLFEVEEQNRLEQRGLLKRFSMSCIGVQPSLLSMRTEKNEKYKELMNNPTSKEYQNWFLKYNPKSKKSDLPKVSKKTIKKYLPKKEPTVEDYNDPKPLKPLGESSYMKRHRHSRTLV